jgi:hypothetical protein
MSSNYWIDEDGVERKHANQYNTQFDAPKGVLRQKVNNVGRKIPMEINCFKAELAGINEVHQYDVSFVPMVNLRKVTEKLWNSKAVQNKLGGKPWIYDNNKLAW